MPTLRNLLVESHIFTTDQQRIDLIKMMAFRQCFNKELIIAASKSEDVTQKKTKRTR